MEKYLALLRGINVGGKNLIKMPHLVSCFEANGFCSVVTYIQSGNVIFESESSDLAGLTLQIEEMRASKFRYEAKAVLQSRKQLLDVVKKAPKGFGAQPARYRYDVLFLKPPMTAPAVMKDLPCKTGVDRAWAGPGVVYYSRLISKAAQSRLAELSRWRCIRA
jgi:uncharacterized protein (DUF1697 family)